MGQTGSRRLTYDDVLRERPETNTFEELIDGELVVSPAPSFEHQVAVNFLHLRLGNWGLANDALAITGPFDLLVEPTTVVQPDVFLVGPDQPQTLARPLTYPPVLCVEVLSPSNRRHDLVRKRAIYERFGVRELWFVDLDAPTIEQVVLGDDGHYGPSRLHTPGDTLASATIVGLTVDVDEIVGTDAPWRGSR
ncbi:MAG TPA: Uma2 family endonuclease [Nitriliruptorales bacterium]